MFEPVAVRWFIDFHISITTLVSNSACGRYSWLKMLSIVVHF